MQVRRCRNPRCRRPKKVAAASIPRSEPAPPATDRVAPPRPPQRGYVRPNAAQPRRAVSNAARHSGSMPAARVLPGLLKLQEKPAVLFGVVAAVTLTAAALTSYIERHAVEQSSLFVVNSPPLQPGSSATHAGESREAAGPQGAQPELRVQDVPSVASAQEVNGQVAGVATHGETGIDVASRVSQQSALVAAAPVEVSPAAVAGQDDNGSNNAAQPAGHDEETGAQDSAESGTPVAIKNLSVSPPDRLSSDGHTQVAEPARSADSANPAVDTAMTDASGPVARAVTPATGDSPQPLSSGQAVVSAVSANERITRLLEQAGEALREDRLMTPAQRSAYSYYQQVLSLEPGNATARGGMRRIVERYVTLTRHAIQRQDNIKANQYITRALRVRPGDRRLLAMKDSINTMFASARPEPAAAPLESSPQEAKEPRNVFQRLKDFFSRN